MTDADKFVWQPGELQRVPNEDIVREALLHYLDEDIVDATRDRALAALDRLVAERDALLGEKASWSYVTETPLLQAAEAERDRLRAALEFYADPDNYKERGTGTPNASGLYEIAECPVWEDEGDIAREALRGHQ